MNCLLLTVFGLLSGIPAAVQTGLTPEQQCALTSVGVPSEVAEALFSTEAAVRKRLGKPSSEDTYPAELFPGPDFRVLGYVLPGGTTFYLTVCTAEMRDDLGIQPSQTFCEASVDRAFTTQAAGQAFAFPAQRRLRAVASREFGECDTDYFVLGRLWASVKQSGDAGPWSGATVVLEPAR